MSHGDAQKQWKRCWMLGRGLFPASSIQHLFSEEPSCRVAAPGNYENGGKSSATSHGCAVPGKGRVNKQRNHGWLRYIF